MYLYDILNYKGELFVRPYNFWKNNYTIKIFYDILSKKEEFKEITYEK